jgi:hypothetical protein|nr:MAG TPA: Virulence-associated protein E [Caudoviricetes sp.]
MQTLREYAITDNTDNQKFSPRVYRAYRAIQGLEDDSDKTFAALSKTAKNVNVNELKLVYGSLTAEFTIRELRYDVSQLRDMIKDVAYPRTKKATDEAAELMHDVLMVIAKRVTEFKDYAPVEEAMTVPCKPLEKYIDFLESETYKGVWSDIMKYPFDNQKSGLRKHLMFGFAPSTGKTIITNALDTLYYRIDANVQTRKSFSFDAGVWNGMVNGKFLVITDDDDESQPISPDFIKNFMNQRMASMTAKQGERDFKTYSGSSVIATNTEEEYFSSPQVSKRLILIRLDHKLPDFTFEELNELHNLDVAQILNYVNYEKPTKLFDVKNKWSNKLDVKVEECRNYVNEMGAVKAGSLKKEFGKDIVKAAYPNGAKTKRLGDLVIYGYFAEKENNELPEQSSFDEFNISMLTGLKDTKPKKIKTTFGSMSDNIEAANDMPKTEQAMFGLFTGTGVKTDEIDKATGIVLDIDKSKLKSLKEIKLPYAFIAYETSSSKPDKLRYRIVLPGIESKNADEYRENVIKVGKLLKDDIDPTCEAIAHRYFIGGKNIVINYKPLIASLPRDTSGIVDRVSSAVAGERNSITYWALNRAKEANDEDLAVEVLRASQCDEAEIERFAKRWDNNQI